MVQSGKEGLSVQEQFAPKSRCFGCGCANPRGLGLRSFVQGPELTAMWEPKPEFEAFPGVVNGGILGALLDCHQNWMALISLWKLKPAASIPCTVTAQFEVKLKRPTPSHHAIVLRAWTERIESPKVWVQAEITVEGIVTATGSGCFVEVFAPHPAAHRWGEDGSTWQTTG